MALWRDVKRKDWRFEFRLNGIRYTGSGYQTKGAALAAREEKRKEAQKEETRTVTAFSSVANLYLDYAQRRFAKKTYQYKSLVYRHFLAHCKEDIDITLITPHILHSYLNTRPSNYNYNVHRKELCALFSFARHQLKIKMANPCWDLEKMPYTPPRKTPMSEEDLLKLIMASDPLQERPLILVLILTLARIDEILRLTWEDVNFEQQTITLWTRKRKDGAYESDCMPMNQDLHDVLWRLWQTRVQDHWVFFNQKTQDRFHRRPKMMPGLCKRAGLSRPYGFHSIRHFMATYLADRKKISKKTISTLLRHRSLGTTEIYLGSVDESARLAMKSIENDFVHSFCAFDEKAQKKAQNSGIGVQ